eukprot:11690958-Alexandrium_andersonii.AAC.1
MTPMRGRSPAAHTHTHTLSLSKFPCNRGHAALRCVDQSGAWAPSRDLTPEDRAAFRDRIASDQGSRRS